MLQEKLIYQTDQNQENEILNSNHTIQFRKNLKIKRLTQFLEILKEQINQKQLGKLFVKQSRKIIQGIDWFDDERMDSAKSELHKMLLELVGQPILIYTNKAQLKRTQKSQLLNQLYKIIPKIGIYKYWQRTL
ncbi:unnamed protein product [Paramecium octaurelia]|uniref:Uncharacterized protein n=1 Tax=Paramecium octaurelia TaxID=43137 RepID=A0A8S1VJF2_PAROT|nr:unnamed protein product [Paramecium octaurelia]